MLSPQASARRPTSRTSSCSPRRTPARRCTGSPTSTTSASRPTTSDGEVVGERRFLGLYASTAYTESVLRVPLVAEKVQAVLDRSGVAPDSHTGKDLLGVLESYPRDELIQASIEQLYETAMAVTQLQERRRTKLFIREDDFGRFVSCLVYIPRDRYNTGVRLRMADILKETFGGESVEFSRAGQRVRPVPAAVRRPGAAGASGCARSTRPSWTPSSSASSRSAAPGPTASATPCAPTHGEEAGDRLMDRFGRAFPTAYEETFTVNQGLADLAHLDRLGDGQRHERRALPPGRRARRPSAGSSCSASTRSRSPTSCRSSATWASRSSTSSPSRWRAPTAPPCTSTTSACGCATPRSGRSARTTGCASSSRAPSPRSGTAAPSPTASTGSSSPPSSTWRQVVVLRTVAKYLRQTRATYSQDYLEDALVSHPAIARDLVELWQTRFDPRAVCRRVDGSPAASGDRAPRRGGRRARGPRRPRRRVLARPRPHHPGLPRRHPGRAAHELLPAGRRRASTSRTSRSSSTPRPCPTCRHPGRSSRSGSTARGSRACTCASARSPAAGCAGPTGARTSAPRSSAWSRRRWSRTPSSCPTGSKGGFYPKQLPDPAVDREAWLEEGKAAYRMFISGLLDITDNRVSGASGAARARGAPRRRRRLPRRRRRQGHGHVLRHRQRGGAVLRLLARRRVRLGRLGRLRPQGDGHHRPRCVGVGQAALPRDGRRHPERRTSPSSASAT